ncbi:hypothetical protein Tco_0718539 [Tanacetum coccineum]
MENHPGISITWSVSLDPGLIYHRYGVLNVFDMTYWGFLGVGTTFDIFQNLHILYLRYGALPSFEYGVLILFPSWYLVKSRHRYAVSSLMDTAYWYVRITAYASPTALSPGYIVDSNPKDESEDGPTDYPADGGDDDDDSSRDHANEEEEESYKEEEEQSRLRPMRLQLHHHHLHTILLLGYTTSPTYVQAPLGYRAAGLRAASPPTHDPLPLPSPPLSPLLLPSTDHRSDIPEAVLPPWKRLCLSPGPRFEVRESSSAARPSGGYRAYYGFIGTLDAKLKRDRVRDMGYGITDVWEDSAEATKEVPPTTIAELSQRVTDLVTTIRQDTNGIYVRFGDARDDWALLRGQVNMLRRDRCYHLNTAILVESKARVSQETQLIAALGRIDTLEARELAHTYNLKDADSCS